VPSKTIIFNHSLLVHTVTTGRLRRFREPGLVQETGIAYRRHNPNPSANIQRFVATLRKTVEQTVSSSLGLSQPFIDTDLRQMNLFCERYTNPIL
jgi:hypothetical protein